MKVNFVITDDQGKEICDYFCMKNKSIPESAKESVDCLKEYLDLMILRYIADNDLLFSKMAINSISFNEEI